MTWSYDVTDLATSEKDQIRLEVGDTDERAQLLQDEEILQAIAVEGNFWNAAARCAELIGRLFLRRVDTRLGRSMMVTYSKTADAYFAMAARLRQKGLGTRVPWAGGMSVADKIAYQQDASIVQPAFARNMMENPWVGGYTPDTLAPIGGGPGPDVDDDFFELT